MNTSTSQIDPYNYEMYYNMGFECLEKGNADQAYLCFENALYHCGDASSEDGVQIINTINELYDTYSLSVRDTAIIIVSYNSLYLQQKNIESIRNTLLPDSYKIIVVDNASTDGVTKWLEEQDDIILIKNDNNLGFSPACNLGVEALNQIGSSSDYDIFLLNNDTRLTPNALFWLRMGLYSDAQNGAVGAVSNYAGNEQQLELMLNSPAEYISYGEKNNIPMDNAYEERVRLSGFAMLIRAGIWEAVGGMDESFAPGYFEDDDLSIRISALGYKLLVCSNSFIYHAGSQSFSHVDRINELLLAHHRLFIQKNGFDILDLAAPRRELISQIPFSADDAFNILFVECGIGADMKYIHRHFPNANIIGIEKNPAQYNICKARHLVFPDVNALAANLTNPIFMVLVLDRARMANYTQEEINTIASMCISDCVVLPQEDPYSGFPFSDIKLVIWDLDDTLWSGTLSEGAVKERPLNSILIKELADCGIVNSVSSKNDETSALNELTKLGLADYMVFNNINWQGKGYQIRGKLTDMKLRPENVLFIDDNIRNLEEAKHEVPGLLTATPEITSALSKYISRQPKVDLTHKRLGRYKLLETKVSAQSNAGSPVEFLIQSKIKIWIDKDCGKNIDRISELLERTNQLNYTKKRINEAELRETLNNPLYECACIHVADRFGDYGISGFICLNKQDHALIHFLFSCRILGMNVEQYLYDKLEYPELDIVSPVAVKLCKNTKVNWINECTGDEYSALSDSSGQKSGNNPMILLKGPCDLSSIEVFLSEYNSDCEFNYVNSQGFITTGQNHSMHLCEALRLSDTEITELLDEAPFIVRGDFETRLFTQEYDVICYSLLPDCHAGLYKNKSTGNYISFGSKNFDLTSPENASGYINGTIVNHAFPFTAELINDFSQKWDFVGCTPTLQIIQNLETMFTNIPGSPRFILLLGSEIEYAGINEEFANHAPKHIEVNRAVEDWALTKKNVFIINMTDYIKSQDDFLDSTNHFSRNVYNQIANRIKEIIEKE